MNPLTPEEKKIAYRARRGLKELDLYIDPYVKYLYPLAPPEDRQLFALLVEQEDPDLLDWFLGYRPCDNAALAGFIHKLIHAVQQLPSAP